MRVLLKDYEGKKWALDVKTIWEDIEKVSYTFTIEPFRQHPQLGPIDGKYDTKPLGKIHVLRMQNVTQDVYIYVKNDVIDNILQNIYEKGTAVCLNEEYIFIMPRGAEDIERNNVIGKAVYEHPEFFTISNPSDWFVHELKERGCLEVCDLQFDQEEEQERE